MDWRPKRSAPPLPATSQSDRAGGDGPSRGRRPPERDRVNSRPDWQAGTRTGFSKPARKASVATGLTRRASGRPGPSATPTIAASSGEGCSAWAITADRRRARRTRRYRRSIARTPAADNARTARNVTSMDMAPVEAAAAELKTPVGSTIVSADESAEITTGSGTTDGDNRKRPVKIGVIAGSQKAPLQSRSRQIGSSLMFSATRAARPATAATPIDAARLRARISTGAHLHPPSVGPAAPQARRYRRRPATDCR
jgi:hypothetical protein